MKPLTMFRSTQKVKSGRGVGDNLPHNSRMKLLHRHSTRTSDNTNTSHRQNVRNFFRNLRLQLFLWKNPVEYRKVALYKSRLVAAFHTFLHLIPLSGAITLLTLHWAHYWISTKFDDATTLQFVAKFHELLMQASIIDVLLCIVRTQAVSGYVPLGALSVIVQPTQLSYLWSLDFVSLLSVPGYNWWRKAFLAISIPLMILMTALVGPSAAVLMIPRPDIPHRHSTIALYQNGSESTIFPSSVNRSHGMAFNFQKWNASRFLDYKFYDTKNRLVATFEYPGEGGLLLGPSRVLQYSAPVPKDLTGEKADDQSSIATTPSILSVNVLHEFSALAPVGPPHNLTLFTTHPLVLVECEEQAVQNESAGYAIYISDNGTRSTLSNTSLDLYSEAFNSSGPYFNEETKVLHLEPLWLRSPDMNSTSMLGVIFNLTKKSSLVKVCTISAYWRAEEAMFSNEGIISITQDVIGGRDGMEAEALRPISIAPSDVPLSYAGNFSSNFHDILLFSNTTEYAPTLSALFADALSRVPVRAN